MNRVKMLGLVAVLGFFAAAPAYSTQIFVTNFSQNVQLSTYCSCYPAQEVSGFISDGNKYGTGSITYSLANPAGNDAQLLSQGGTLSSSTPILSTISSPIAIYLLLTADQPVNAQSGLSVQINGSGGYAQSFNLINGTDVRCFVTNTVCDVNTFNNTSTKNVYASPSNTIGYYGLGSYVIDEVRLVLDAGWVGRTLSSIDLSLPNSGNNGQILLSAITVDGTVGTGPNTNPAPEPGSFAMAIGGAAALWFGRRRFSR